MDRDELYIGYMPDAPPSVAAHVKRWTLGGLAVVWIVAAAIAVAQHPFAVAFFDFGAPRTYEGTVELTPHPVLRVDRPGETHGRTGSTFLLVGFGKHGADSDVSELDGRRVRLEATPIYRDDQTMLEIVPDSVEALTESTTVGEHPADAPISLGQQTIVGEIVDSKCHLGVMKPGNQKPHRACATLCIRGGVPPIVIVRQDGRPVDHLLLVGSDGRALNKEVLEWVAEPVRMTGELVRMGDLWMFKTEPRTFKRIE